MKIDSEFDFVRTIERFELEIVLVCLKGKITPFGKFGRGVIVS